MQLLGRRRYYSAMNRLRNKTFPVPLETVLLVILLVGAVRLANVDPTNGMLPYFEALSATIFGKSVVSQVVACSFVGLAIWYSGVLLLRCFISAVLSYMGWLSETPGKTSLPTKLWMAFIHQLNRCNPKFLAFQDLLPTLPLPSLDKTIDAYLQSMKPLLSDAEFDELTKKAEDFRSGVGRKLQRKLWIRWLTTDNYVTDWWNEFAYMRDRGSLLNKSVSGIDTIFRAKSSNQAATAATYCVIHQMFLRDLTERQTAKPITFGGSPTCLEQYVRCYRTLREPGLEIDKCVYLGTSARHAAVNYAGCWYKVPLYCGGRMLRPAELEPAIQSILERQPDPAEGEAHLVALTTGQRADWARARDRHFKFGANAESLKIIETAVELVFLCDESFEYDENDSSKLDEWYTKTFRNAHLWADKPTCMVFYKNGHYNCYGEHGAADGLVFMHLAEFFKYHENYSFSYTPDGHVKGRVEVIPQIERLKWNFSKDCLNAIERSFSVGQEISADIDIAALIFKEFGKNFMKQIRVSPDAFIQMALQLAYYQDVGSFGLTYEAATTRLFKRGRTETVRSVSEQSCGFVRAMLEPAVDVSRSTAQSGGARASVQKATRLRLLRVACDAHQTSNKSAMAGRGCDRHLFALRVLGRRLQVASPFLDDISNQPFLLSTSQTPQHQQTEYMKTLNGRADLFYPAGAFACPDGSDYGVCYGMSACGNLLAFHIAASRANPRSDAKRMRQHLVDSLRLMKQLV